jgi:hypothetical protein
MWGCRAHWIALPKHLRDRVWDTYQPGQEKDLSPSAEYMKVASEIEAWIQTNAMVDSASLRAFNVFPGW